MKNRMLMLVLPLTMVVSGGVAAPGESSLAERVAFMRGHVEAGLALYRAGEPQMAAPHLMHPVSETHADERAGLAELGFDASLFEAVSEALESGVPAADVEPRLAAAEENLASVARHAGGEPVAVMRYLMDLVEEEYRVGVQDGVVTDPGEYQDAYGFTVVAMSLVSELPANARADVADALQALRDLWRDGPVPVSDPASPGTVTGAVAAVRNALADAP